jgi:hypothetical protein
VSANLDLVRSIWERADYRRIAFWDPDRTRADVGREE